MAETYNIGKSSVKGRVVNTPEEVETTNGTLATFRLAENKRFYDRGEQQWKDGSTTFYDVGISKAELKENVLASLEKGQQVTVEGNHQIKSFSRENGETGIGHRLYATDVAASLEWDSLQRHPSASPSAQQDAHAAVEAQTQQQGPAQSGPEPVTDEAKAIRAEAAQSWAQPPAGEPENPESVALRQQAQQPPVAAEQSGPDLS